MPRRKEPRIPDAVLDQLLAGADPKAAFDPNGLIDDLKKALAERVLNAEMDHHLAGEEPGNRRNGYGKKTVITDTGQIELEVPRDRQARFDPQLIAKYQRRFPGFDDKIISMYARGMSTREIVGHLHDLYGIEVSPDLISAVTDAVLEEVAAWQARPLEGDCQEFRARLSGLTDQSMAAVKRSPKRTANCDLAMDHSRGGMIHSFSERFKTRKRSLVAASSLGKWPLARTARRSLALSASIAFVV